MVDATPALRFTAIYLPKILGSRSKVYFLCMKMQGTVTSAQLNSRMFVLVIEHQLAKMHDEVQIAARSVANQLDNLRCILRQFCGNYNILHPYSRQNWPSSLAWDLTTTCVMQGVTTDQETGSSFSKSSVTNDSLVG